MRTVLLLVSASAAAQTPDSTATRRRGPSADAVAGGAVAGAVAVLAGTLAMRAVGYSEEARGWAFLLYPVGSAAGVYDIGRRRGRHGTARGTALGAVRGTLFAAGGVLLAGYGVSRAFDVGDDSAAGAAILAGLAVMVVTPPYFAAAGYDASDVQPVVLVGPAGERVAGLALRVAL